MHTKRLGCRSRRVQILSNSNHRLIQACCLLVHIPKTKCHLLHFVFRSILQLISEFQLGDFWGGFLSFSTSVWVFIGLFLRACDSLVYMSKWFPCWAAALQLPRPRLAETRELLWPQSTWRELLRTSVCNTALIARDHPLQFQTVTRACFLLLTILRF